MIPLSSIPDIAQAAMNFAMAYGQSVPATTANTALAGNPKQLVTAAISAFSPGNSPVTAICNLAEAIYAFRADIPAGDARAAALTLAGQCAMFAASNSWQKLGDGSPARGVGICWAMQRELGEAAPTGTTWPAASADPTVSPLFLAPVVAAPPSITPPTAP